MNTILISLTLAALCIATYLLIARLSRKDERGRQLWRKLITPTPIDAFSSSDKESGQKIVSHQDHRPAEKVVKNRNE
jgi:hypothetical protein